MPEYKNEVYLVDWHIPSQHCSEMVTQSKVVRLFVRIFGPFCGNV